MARAPTITGVAGSSGTPPTLSVSGRTDGDGYEVTAGARSITITAEAGATLVTTVNGPTSGDVTVTDSTTTTPDWTAPADEALTIQVVATKDGLTSEVTFTEQTAYGGGSASFVEIIDPAGVSYDFLTTGGTGGSGGEGSHTVNGESWTLSYEGSSGPDTGALVSGVLQHRGNLSTKRAYYVIDMGEDVSAVPFAVYVSVENLGASSDQSFIMRLAPSASPGIGTNYLGFLYGWDNSPAGPDDTQIHVRKWTSGAANTVIEQITGLTDLTTTPTRFCLKCVGGHVQISYDQGDASIPTNGANLGTMVSSDAGVAAVAATRLNMRYLHLYCLEDVDVRFIIHRLETA